MRDKSWFTASAEISPCGKFRYVLRRTWGIEPPLVFCMLNPSTANALEDDQTISKICRYGKRMGYGGIVVVNLFAYRTKSPEVLAKNGWQIGPDNDKHIINECLGQAVCVAWGANVRKAGPGRDRATEVMQLLHNISDVYALEQTADFIPKHPLYLRGDLELERLYEQRR